jgi:hypothetical protein
MNGRAIPRAYLFRLYVCDSSKKERMPTGDIKKMLHYWEEFQSLATKWYPNKVEMNRLCALVEDNCLNHFKNILKKKVQLWTDFLLLL